MMLKPLRTSATRQCKGEFPHSTSSSWCLHTQNEKKTKISMEKFLFTAYALTVECLFSCQTNDEHDDDDIITHEIHRFHLHPCRRRRPPIMPYLSFYMCCFLLSICAEANSILNRWQSSCIKHEICDLGTLDSSCEESTVRHVNAKRNGMRIENET